MKKYLLVLVFICWSFVINAQCLTSSLVINTGYDPTTGLAITPGTNGGAPVHDPHWLVSAESPTVATAIALMGTGLIEVVPVASADIVTTEALWVSDPPATPGGWISCLNSNTYTTDGSGPTGTAYNMNLRRPFRMCVADNITFDLWIADDNWISTMDVDGTVLTYTESGSPSASHFGAFTHFTFTMFLSAGTHNLNVVVNNYNDAGGLEVNPTGLNIHGTVSSAGSLNSLVSESYLSCASYTCAFTCNNVSLPDSLHPCAGDVITLPAVLTGTDSVLGITWSPATGLSSTTILTPVLTAPTTSGNYYISVQSLIPFNLVANGNFSLGNVGFTSAYSYVTGPGSLVPEGVYTITTDPSLEHPAAVSFGDHTTGTGNMMAINGASTPISVWCETIPVLPNTTYDFAAWVANWSTADVGAAEPDLQFMINGVLIGVPFLSSAAPGVWQEFSATWNSGVSTTANICIFDECVAAGGNDFALDDISFQEICVANDSVYVDIKVPDTTTTNMDTTLCIALAPITLTGTAGYASYLWNTGAATISIPAAASGVYWVYNNNHCATLIDTFKVNYIPLPVVFLGNDTSFCTGDSITLSSVQPAGTTYLWSTGSTGDTIHAKATGTYWLQLNNGCAVTDSIHVLLSPFPVVNLGPDQFNCLAKPDTLQSSVSYTGPTYLWSTGGTLDTIIADTTGTYWLQVTVAGCASADTIHVTIIYDTFTLGNIDTGICLGKSVQAKLTANPAATFQWLPTAGVPANTTSSPMITPDTSAEYVVHIYLAGCPEKKDSFLIDVQPNPKVYMGGNQSVCQFDTLHLHATVTPAWYTHYIYKWSPGTYLNDTTIQNVVFTPGDSGKIYLIVSTPAGCSSGDSAMIIVHPGDFAGLDSIYNLCPGDSVQLKPTGGVSYRWHPGIYLSDSTAASPWARCITSEAYTVIVKSQFNCLDTVSTRIVIEPAAVLNLGDSVTLYPGGSYQINPLTNCSSFEWFPVSGLSNAYVSDPLISPEISTKYKVYGTTTWGCSVVDSINIYIDVSGLLTLPNAFTPDAGINNKLYILQRGIAKLNYFRIYNRWGNKVYESTNINDGWDGSFNGKPQPYDVFVYEVEAVSVDGKTFHKSGNVTLIR